MDFPRICGVYNSVTFHMGVSNEKKTDIFNGVDITTTGITNWNFAAKPRSRTAFN